MNKKEFYFSSSLARCRSCIERAWGLLKNRFGALHKQLKLKEPKSCAKVIQAAVLLHNFIIENRMEEDNEFYPPIEDNALYEEMNEEGEEEEEAITPFANERLNQLFQTFRRVNNL